MPLSLAGSVSILQSLVRQREGELSALKDHLRAVEQRSAELSEQVISLQRDLAASAVTKQRLQTVEQQLQSMSIRYDAALQLIGEKEDELQELHTDVQHIKEMFRAQIEALIGQIKQLQSQSNNNQQQHQPNSGNSLRRGENGDHSRL